MSGQRARERVGEAQRSVLRHLEAASKLSWGGGWLTQAGLRQLCYPHWAVPEALLNLQREGKIERRALGSDVHWRLREAANDRALLARSALARAGGHDRVGGRRLEGLEAWWALRRHRDLVGRSMRAAAPSSSCSAPRCAPAARSTATPAARSRPARCSLPGVCGPNDAPVDARAETWPILQGSPPG
jgi:hypothetical protein